MNRRNFFKLIPCLACVPIIKKLCEDKNVDIRPVWEPNEDGIVEIHYYSVRNDKWQKMDGPPKKPQFIDLTL